jgi:hypothetical protein
LKDEEKVRQEQRQLKTKYRRETKLIKAGSATYQDFMNQTQTDDQILIDDFPPNQQ